MSDTKIEYLDATWNFLTGCNNWKDPAICGGGGSEFKCWAKSMADRFGRDFNPTYTRKAFMAKFPLIPSRIGVCFTGDLFQDSIAPNDWPVSLRETVLSRVECHPEHQFLFLTKCPWNIRKWGKFPDNAWVGISVTNERQAEQAWRYFHDEVDARNKWVSFEPLKSPINQPVLDSLINQITWVVIGGLSNKPINRQPQEEWVMQIVRTADADCVPIWIKDNLKYLSDDGTLRHELPVGFFPKEIE